MVLFKAHPCVQWGQKKLHFLWTRCPGQNHMACQYLTWGGFDNEGAPVLWWVAVAFQDPWLETCKMSQVAFTHKGMFQARETRCPRASSKPWCANQVFRTSKTISLFTARVDPFKDALISLILVLSAAFSSKAAKQQSRQQSPGWACLDKPLSLCIWFSAIPSTSVSDGTSRISSSSSDPAGLAMPKKKRKNWELVANRFESWSSKEIRTIGENEWREDWRAGNGEWVNLKAWRNWFMPLVLVHPATTQLIKDLWI